MTNLFVGDYLAVLEVVFEKLESISVLIEKKNLDSSVANFCKNNNITYYVVETKKEINDWVLDKSFEYVIVASFGLILPYNFINRSKLIFNFHPGDVYACRGRHPLPSAIKRGDSRVAISVHQIDSEEIDKGKLFAQYFIALDYDASYQDNYDRVLASLTFLATQLCGYLSANKTPPLWNWSPLDDSYLPKLESQELNKLITIDKIKDF